MTKIPEIQAILDNRPGNKRYTYPMKLSMWMLASRLRKWNPRIAITEGKAEITKVRLIGGNAAEIPDTLFVQPARDIFDDPVYHDTVLLIYKRDMIFIEGDAEDVMNETLAALDFFNTWEESIRAAVESRDAFGRIIELTKPVIENLMTLSMLDGSVIFRSEPYNSGSARNDGSLPNYKDFEGFITPDGNTVSDWSNIPTEYYMRSRKKHLLGFYIAVEDERVAMFSVVENNRPFNPGDLQCLGLLSRIFSHIASIGKFSPIRPNVAVLKNLLDGMECEKSFLNQLDRAAPPSPCAGRMMAVFKADETINTMVLRRNLEQRLKRMNEVDFALDYHEGVVAICAEEKFTLFEKEIAKQRLTAQWQIGISLPFSDWNSLPFRYRQAVFAIEQNSINDGRLKFKKAVPKTEILEQPQPGLIKNSRDYAFNHILSLVSQNSDVRELLHPALYKLEQYDTMHKSSLGKTLFCFLENESNVTVTAEKLFLHRNSLRHRLERIEEITGVDLEKSAERAYIYFSYLIKKTADE
jgi:hypothetical protein